MAGGLLAVRGGTKQTDAAAQRKAGSDNPVMLSVQGNACKIPRLLLRGDFFSFLTFLCFHSTVYLYSQRKGSSFVNVHTRASHPSKPE